jgi:hypothetical protein
MIFFKKVFFFIYLFEFFIFYFVFAVFFLFCIGLGFRRGGLNIDDILQHKVLLEALAYSAHIGVAEKDPVME